MNDLELATSEDLIAELQKRFTALVVAGITDLPADKTKEWWLMKYSGGPTVCYGIAKRVAHSIAHDFDNSEDVNEEDRP